MTLAEQREKLVDAIGRARFTLTDWDSAPPEIKENMRYNIEQTFATISAAGCAIIGQEVTQEMIVEGERWGAKRDLAAGIFKAMLAAGDLGRKPE